MRTRTVKRAFTLIEILIVVVILGILAAIVIPQFTDASQDAMEANVRSQLQTIRSQIELYNVQLPDAVFGDYGPGTPLGTFWDGLVNNDYLQQEPRNPLQPAATSTAVGGAAAADVGWVWDGDDLFATDGAGALFVE
jgi:prepilin-type N-terminal cleavage/methylation domain-containing protein